MPEGYVSIFIFIVCAIIFAAGLLWVLKLIRPAAPTPVKLDAYECGIKAASNARGRYTVRFYIVAILFVIFDVETIFLYPWAVSFNKLGVFAFVEMIVFLAILACGLMYAWKKGVLDWK